MSEHKMLCAIRESDYKYFKEAEDKVKWLLEDKRVYRISLASGVEEKAIIHQVDGKDAYAEIRNKDEPPQSLIVGRDPNGELWIATYVP